MFSLNFSRTSIVDAVARPPISRDAGDSGPRPPVAPDLAAALIAAVIRRAGAHQPDPRRRP
jgi:hypothetical protein